MNRWWPHWLMVLCLCGRIVPATGAELDPARPAAGMGSPAERALATSAGPSFESLCFQCHGNKKSKAHLNLERMLGRPDFDGDFKSWERVIEMLERREMPPEDDPQPAEDQRARLIREVRAGLDLFVRQQAGDPGRVVLRRLTGAEYAYTVTDLTGIDPGLERTFIGDAVGGEGFSNVGDVQFIQESTLEHYLEAARLVASHAVVGAGPLQFYRDPGQTGQELSAIHRIREIYRQHGFRTGAGEGAVAFGLERYSKALFAAWRFRYRRELGVRAWTLAKMAGEEGIEVRFLDHIWSVVNDGGLSFPASEIAAAWRSLPAPRRPDPGLEATVRERCEELYRTLRDWQSTLAANSGSDEEAPVLGEDSFRPALEHSFRAVMGWPRGATNAVFHIVAIPVGGDRLKKPVVQWRGARIRFQTPRAGTGAGQANAGTRGRAPAKPLKDVIDALTAGRLRFGEHPNGTRIEADSFVTVGPAELRIEMPVPPGAIQAELVLNARLDLERGDDGLVRCLVRSTPSEGATAAASGTVSALLANPAGGEIPVWKAAVAEFALKLPQVSHREPAPSDRDPIPPPYDNSYNNPERNDFHYVIKYHRDDRFLSEHILDAATRARLDEAWIDLLTAFDYHGNFLRFVGKKFKLETNGLDLARLDAGAIERLAIEPRSLVDALHAGYRSMHDALRDAQPRHVNEALEFAARAWRRPLRETEEGRLRAFYSNLRDSGGMNHAEAIRALLARILVAPGFLYRAEIPKQAGGISSPRGLGGPGRRETARPSGIPDGLIPLSDWELASRLSYFLWASLPDAELARAARSGDLRTPEQLGRQARRMLRDPRARRFASEFFGQWFGFYRFDEFRGVDTGRFPEFTDSLKAALHDEAVSFFEHIVREDRPVADILFADYSFLNRELAVHYGIDSAGAPTNGMARIDGLHRFRRGGLLRLGAVLTATSAPLRTSAVKRGDWVLRRVLGTPVPPPPDDAGSIAPDDLSTDGKTVRQRLDAHRREASCVNCHSRIDPLGFALEHFDSIGRWRDTYRDGQSIDPSGTLKDGTEISGLEGLDRYLKGQEAKFHRTLCAKVLGYALGRGERVTDRPLLGEMMVGLRAGGGFAGLVVQVVGSTQFRYRRADAQGVDPAGPTAS